MPGELQPLSQNFAIVDENGFPTQYFIKYCQDRGIDIVDSITLAQAQELIAEAFAGRRINTDAPLNGGGALDHDLALGHDDSGVVAGTYGDATNVPQFTVDDKGHVTNVVEVPITGGGGGGGFGAVPTRVDFPLTTGSSAFITANAAAINIGGAANTTGIQGVGVGGLASPFNLSAEIEGFAGDQFNSYGIWVSDGVKFMTFAALALSSTQVVLEFARWSNSGSFTSSSSLNWCASKQIPYLRLAVNGGSVIPYVSFDGVFWWQMFAADTTWLNANECGAHTNRNNAGISPICCFKGFTIT